MARITGREPVDPVHPQCGGSRVACLWILRGHVRRRHCGLDLGNDCTAARRLPGLTEFTVPMILLMACLGEDKMVHGMTSFLVRGFG